MINMEKSNPHSHKIHFSAAMHGLSPVQWSSKIWFDVKISVVANRRIANYYLIITNIYSYTKIQLHGVWRLSLQLNSII